MTPARRAQLAAAPCSKPCVNPFPFRPAQVASLTVVGQRSRADGRRDRARETSHRARCLSRLALDRERAGGPEDQSHIAVVT